MDAPMFLNQSGAIVTRFDGDGRYYFAESLPVIPHVETVAFPSALCDAGALLSEHPDELVKLTYSSGAAITFFCDSEAGGSNSSGDGSFENPWRNMRVAAANISCYFCQLLAAYDYIQLKVKGNFDYLSSRESWTPVSGIQCGRMILGGWDSVTRLPDGVYFHAGYFRDLYGGSLRPFARGGRIYHSSYASNCVLVGSAYPVISTAINCSAETEVSANVLYNCSANQACPSAAYAYGGSYTVSRTSLDYGNICNFDRAYSTTVEFSVNYPDNDDNAAVSIISGYGIVVSATAAGSRVQIVSGCINCEYLASSIVDVRAFMSKSIGGGRAEVAAVKPIMGGVTTIVGGSFCLSAVASGGVDSSHTDVGAGAYARIGTTVVSGATVTYFTEANVSVPDGFSSGTAEEIEGVENCEVTIRRIYRNGAMELKTWSSGTCE